MSHVPVIILAAALLLGAAVVAPGCGVHATRPPIVVPGCEHGVNHYQPCPGRA